MTGHVHSRVVGVDVGGTNIKGARVRLDGGLSVEEQLSVATGREEGPDAVVSQVESMALDLAGDSGFGGVFGVAIPGSFDEVSGEVRSLPNLPGWEGFPLRERLETDLGTPVVLVNDAQAFTLAEASHGAARGAASVVGMTLGTGIGGGIVLDGRLHRGVFGTAGEIGHQVIVVDGPPCGCGARGCLEALARPSKIAAAAGAADFEEAMRLFADGDRAALEAVGTMVEYLAVGIANVITILGPEVVVLGGGVAEAGERLFDPVREAVGRRLQLVPAERVVIVAAELGSAAGSIGAAIQARRPDGPTR